MQDSAHSEVFVGGLVPKIVEGEVVGVEVVVVEVFMVVVVGFIVGEGVGGTQGSAHSELV